VPVHQLGQEFSEGDAPWDVPRRVDHDRHDLIAGRRVHLASVFPRTVEKAKAAAFERPRILPEHRGGREGLPDDDTCAPRGGSASHELEVEPRDVHENLRIAEPARDPPPAIEV